MGCAGAGYGEPSMIGRIRGTLIEKQAPTVLVEVDGIAYEIAAPMTTFYDLPAIGEPVILHIHMLVRQDAQLLYGFVQLRDRDLFRSLIKVNGVGAKMALALLSGMSADELVVTVRSNDITSLTRIPGIGKKTAERLIVEMRDRLEDWGIATPVTTMGVSGDGHAYSRGPDYIKDAVSALIALGYKPVEASRMVRAVDSDGLASEDIIRQALQAMAGAIK